MEKNNYQSIDDMLYGLKEQLSDKDFMDREVEMYIMTIRKEVERMKEEAHQTKQKIVNEIMSKF